MGTANLSGMDNYSLNDGIEGFRRALAEHGLYPEHIIPDTPRPQRFNVGDGKKNDDGWYVLHSSSPMVGFYGNWKESTSYRWFEKDRNKMTYEERQIVRKKMAIEKARREKEREEREKEAAKRAADKYAKLPDATVDNEYAAKKGIKPYEAHQAENGALMILIRDENKYITSGQYIFPNSDKRFVTGGKVKDCFFTLRSQHGLPDAVLLCEGYATACSLYDAMGKRCTVVAALSGGNIKGVAKVLRRRFGAGAKIIVCAEDDSMKRKNNVGMEYAIDAAREIGALLAIPEFGEGRTKDDSDFNDMQRLLGLEAVAGAIHAAKPITDEEADHEHEPQRSPEVFSDADSDCAPGVAPEPSIPGGAGDQEADSGNHGTAGDVESDQGFAADELIPLSAYEEGAHSSTWIDPYPGAMETLFRICMSYQHKPQPVLTVAAALCAMSACLHGKYRWPDRLRGNLYIIGLAGTGQGKSEPMGLVEHVVTVGGGVYQSNIASAPAVEELLIKQQDVRAALVIDEVAHTLTNVTSKNVSPHMSQFGKTILELFTRSATGYRTRLLANKDSEQKNLHHPYMTFYGTSTHEKMNDISAAFIGDGTLGRFLIVEGEAFVRTQKVLNYENPRKLIDKELGQHIRNIYDYGSEIQEQEQECRIMKVSPEADAFIDELNQWSDDQQENSDNILKSLYVRAVENIKRIALVLAVWDNEMGVHTRIERCHLEWAREFVLKSQSTVLKFVSQMTDSPIIKKANKTLELMQDAANGNKPFAEEVWNTYAEETGFIQHRAIYRKVRAEPKDWDQIIKHLKEMGYIEEDDVKKGSKEIAGYRLIKRGKN